LGGLLICGDAGMRALTGFESAAMDGGACEHRGSDANSSKRGMREDIPATSNMINTRNSIHFKKPLIEVAFLSAHNT